MSVEEPAPDGQTDRVDGTVMAAIDRSGETERLIVADVAVDDAWIAILASEAPTLAEWR